MTIDTQLFPTLLLAAHWLIVIGLSLRVIARRLPVGVALAWLAVVFAVPFLGAAAYLTFGGRRLDAKRVARLADVQRASEPARAALRAGTTAAAPPTDSPGFPLFRQALGLTGIPALGGNQLALHQDYAAVFDALIADIEGANESCRLGFYIWEEGGRADDVADALLRARARGVRCRVLVDAVGAKRFLAGEGAKALRGAGVEVQAALPPSLSRRADLRYHRKVVVIDDRIGYAGSQNLVDPRFFKQRVGVGRWVDAIVRIEGPAVNCLATSFEMDWSVEGAVPFTDPPWSGVTEVSAPAIVQVVPSGPVIHPDAIRQFLLTAIYSARESVTVTTPYFVPDESILTALVSAAQRGVAVTVTLPVSNDSLMVRYASVAHFDDLMAAGVRIALFQGGLLHTKSLVVDGAVTVFGSVNLDMRSFWLNFEISLFVYDTRFAEQVSTLQRDYLAQSVFVDAAEWARRSAGQRFLENAARLAGPLL